MLTRCAPKSATGVRHDRSERKVRHANPLAPVPKLCNGGWVEKQVWRRVAAAFVLFTAALTGVPTQPAHALQVPEFPGKATGDVNCDKMTSRADVQIILEAAVDLRTPAKGCPLKDPSTEYDRSNADVDGNGMVDLADALLVARCVDRGDVGCSPDEPDEPELGDEDPGPFDPPGPPAEPAQIELVLAPSAQPFVCNGTDGIAPVVGELRGFAPGEPVEIQWDRGRRSNPADDQGTRTFQWECIPSRARSLTMVATGLDSGRTLSFDFVTATEPTPSLQVALRYNPFVCIGSSDRAPIAGEISGFDPNEEVLIAWDRGASTFAADANGVRTFRWECDLADIRTAELTAVGVTSRRSVTFTLEMIAPAANADDLADVLALLLELNGTSLTGDERQTLALITQAGADVDAPLAGGAVLAGELSSFVDGFVCYLATRTKTSAFMSAATRDSILRTYDCASGLPDFNPDTDRTTSSGNRADICAGASNREGRVTFARDMQQQFPGIEQIGEVSCREIRNPPNPTATCNGRVNPPSSTCWSTHADGRGVDLMVFDDRATGDASVAYLLEEIDGIAGFRARAMGVIQIIWYDRCWGPPNRFNDGDVSSWSEMRLCDVTDHRDHPHVTLAIRAADAAEDFPYYAWRSDYLGFLQALFSWILPGANN